MNKLMNMETKQSPGNSIAAPVYSFLGRIVFKTILTMIKLGVYLMDKGRGEPFIFEFPEEEEVTYKSIYEEGWMG